MHDGFKNAYSLIIDKEKIVLNPLPPNQVHKIKLEVGGEKKRDILMLSGMWVERALSNGKQGLALLMLDSNKSAKVTPLHPIICPPHFPISRCLHTRFIPWSPTDPRH